LKRGGIVSNEKKAGSMKGIEKSSRAVGLRRFSMVQLLIALLGLIWTMAYWPVEQLTPGAFERSNGPRGGMGLKSNVRGPVRD